MGERSDEIEEQISRTREDLRDNLNELEDRVRGALDWRRQFEERPLTMLAAALGGGMLLAALLPGGGNGRRPRAYAEASTRSEGRREAEARARKTEPESDGSLGTFTIFEVQVNPSGITARTARSFTSPAGCKSTGWFGGARGSTF